MDKDAKDQFDRLAFEPFEPARHADAQERIAHALEYIAAQLGEVNQRARRKGEGLAKPDEAAAS